MSTIKDLQADVRQYGMVEELTEALEGISSYRIRQIKDRVLLSKQFFRELWTIYSSMRVDKPARPSHPDHQRDLFIILTSTGGLAGDIDDAIVRRVLADYVAGETDIITIGARGAAQLTARGITPINHFQQPDITKPIDTSPIVSFVPHYRRTFVYYEEFESLMIQRVGRIELLVETQSIGTADAAKVDRDNLIFASEYLFEPTETEVVDYLESVMLSITLTQLIFESQLSQFSARFTAMLAANMRAHDTKRLAQLRYLAARRHKRDEAAHEIVYAMGSVQA